MSNMREIDGTKYYSFNGFTIRGIEQEGEIWLSMRDICSAADIGSYTYFYSKFNESEKRVLLMHSSSGYQRSRAISLKALQQKLKYSCQKKVPAFMAWINETFEGSCEKSNDLSTLRPNGRPPKSNLNQPTTQPSQPVDISNNDINDLTVVILQAIMRKCELIIGQLQQA